MNESICVILCNEKAQHEKDILLRAIAKFPGVEKFVESAVYLIDKEKQKTLKAESDKAEAVRIAIEYIKLYCGDDCIKKITNYDGVCNICGVAEDKKQIEYLTGQKFEKLNR